MRVPLLVANWKMHKGVAEAVAFTRAIVDKAVDFAGTEVVLAPAFTAVSAVASAVRATAIGVAAQNVATDPEGAFTGEVSAFMIKEAGAASVIIGHSERRRMYGETDTVVNRKVRAARAVDLRPIVCVGETLEEREAGQTFSVIDRQITRGLDGFTADDVADFVLAYEPVWAIGTGRTATTAEAGAVHEHVRGRLRQGFGAVAADRCRVIYGGSVRADIIGTLMALPDVDGALVGGNSLDVETFAEIVRRARR
jgi:triosephosphate isomerase